MGVTITLDQSGCLVYIVYFSFFSTVAAYMANKVVYINFSLSAAMWTVRWY